MMNCTLKTQNGQLVELVCHYYTPNTKHNFKSPVAITLVVRTGYDIGSFNDANR